MFQYKKSGKSNWFMWIRIYESCLKEWNVKYEKMYLGREYKYLKQIRKTCTNFLTSENESKQALLSIEDGNTAKL